jgi:hypothetical protein
MQQLHIYTASRELQSKQIAAVRRGKSKLAAFKCNKAAQLQDCRRHAWKQLLLRL